MSLFNLTGDMKKALNQEKKWTTIIDLQGKAEVVFKYYCTPIFHVFSQGTNPQQLCHKLLKSIQSVKPLVINFLHKPNDEIFDQKYFPLDILDPKWLADPKNLFKLKANFPGEFVENLCMHPKFMLTLRL